MTEPLTLSLGSRLNGSTMLACVAESTGPTVALTFHGTGIVIALSADQVTEIVSWRATEAGELGYSRYLLMASFGGLPAALMLHRLSGRQLSLVISTWEAGALNPRKHREVYLDNDQATAFLGWLSDVDTRAEVTR